MVVAAVRDQLVVMKERVNGAKSRGVLGKKLERFDRKDKRNQLGEEGKNMALQLVEIECCKRHARRITTGQGKSRPRRLRSLSPM